MFLKFFFAISKTSRIKLKVMEGETFLQEIISATDQLLLTTSESDVHPRRIRIRNFIIDSWYSSPYPQEYIGLPVLYICEKCLMYLADEQPHLVIFFRKNELFSCFRKF